MLTKSKFVLAALTVLATGCAVERPIEKLKDPDKQYLKKEIFVGGDSQDLFANSVGGQNKIWFAKVTVVKNSTNGGPNFVGGQSDMKMGAFRFTENQLQFVNVVTPYEDTGSALNDLITAWPVTHFDKKLGESDGKVTNVEEEDKDKRWSKKKYADPDFEKPINGHGSFFTGGEADGCYEAISTNLVNGSREVTSNHIQFVLETHYRVKATQACVTLRRAARGDLTYTAQYMYSFRQVKPSELTDYKAYVYKGENDPLVSKYGYFKTVREQLDKDGRIQNVFMMNRWNPNKTHTFYFASDFPAEFKWIFNDPKIGVIKRTNDLFAENGLDVRFEIKENSGQKFGDIRYSFIKFVNEIDGAAPLGYGPSDANPLTGEIVASNVIIWTSSLKYYVRIIDDELKRLPTKFENSSIFQKMKNDLKDEDPASWTSTAQLLDPNKKAGQAFDLMLSQLLYVHPAYSAFTDGFDPAILAADLDLESTGEALQGMSPFNSTYIKKKVEESRNLAQKYLTSNIGRGTDQYHSTIYKMDDVLGDVRNLLVNGKSPQQIIDTLLYRVAIHEFGHNLNLRHNFYGSVDKKNFPHAHPAEDRFGNPIVYEKDGKLEPLVTQPITSSVMDYLGLRQ
ncbi:MAG: hypothetical protein KDD25_00285, partial [Bdellovibrionales bacterium]|nr:hypothetical protein [Bdellovibrionales bacterium]